MLDVKGRLMSDVRELGWVKESDIDDFVIGLGDAIQLYAS